MTMSPFCLINVADIRDHATALHETRETSWHDRLINWMAGFLRTRRA
jgi:hypothetical protein